MLRKIITREEVKENRAWEYQTVVVAESHNSKGLTLCAREATTLSLDVLKVLGRKLYFKFIKNNCFNAITLVH